NPAIEKKSEPGESLPATGVIAAQDVRAGKVESRDGLPFVAPLELPDRGGVDVDAARRARQDLPVLDDRRPRPATRGPPSARQTFAPPESRPAIGSSRAHGESRARPSIPTTTTASARRAGRGGVGRAGSSRIAKRTAPTQTATAAAKRRTARRGREGSRPDS